MVYLLIALFAAVVTPIHAIAGTDTGLTGPEGTVRAFYTLMNEHRCDAAAQFRSGYTAERCGTISDVEIRRVDQQFGTEGTAVVDLDLSFRRAGKAVAWRGFLTLRYGSEGWVIDGASYRSRSTIDLPRYLRTVARVEAGTAADEVKKMARPAPEPAALPSAPPPPKPDVPVAAPPIATPASSPPMFGSDVVLATLWNDRQLEGAAVDRRIARLKRPDRQPPARLIPQTALPPLPAARRGSIRAVKPYGGQKIVALTFDLCERADDVTGYDRDVVSVLRSHRTPATFFAGGKWMRSHPEKTMQLMADPLFEIGNHAWTHGNFRVLNGERADEQIVWTQAQYELLRDRLAERARAEGIDTAEIERIPAVPQTFRFPYGTCHGPALDWVAGHGLAAIQWDVVSGDPDPSLKADDLARRVLERVRPGSIVVFHANARGWKTAQALPAILKTLAADGYRFLTVSELLDSGTPTAADACYEVRPGDNHRYDAIFGEGTG